jgi:hypothetical protein
MRRKISTSKLADAGTLGFRRRSPLAIFFWICRMLKSVERGERFDLVDGARSRLSPDILTAM